MKQQLCLLVFLLFNVLQTNAHLGSPDIFYEGYAGPYKIQVHIQPPDVVPGIACIFIKTKEPGISKIVVQPVYYKYGSEGAPRGDQLLKAPDAKNAYMGQLWLMAFGSASVRVSVEGLKGVGSTIVPVAAVATATRSMDTTTEIILIVLGLLLFIGMVTMLGASAIQAILPAGKNFDSEKKKKELKIMVLCAVFLAGGLYFAKGWWNVVEGKYRKNMYRPFSMQTSMGLKNGSKVLKINLINHDWLDRRLSDLVPDHGKMMHLFLIGDSANVFVHLHPSRRDSAMFYSKLPALAAGTYAVFADVVHENGMVETLTDTLSIGKQISTEPSEDPDDSWWSAVNLDTSSAEYKIIWTGKDSIQEKEFTSLSFVLRDAQSKSLQPDPYLGMAGHAVVMKQDRSVFIHLHPMGTVSMASQAALAGKVIGNITLCNPIPDSLIKAGDTLSNLVDQDRISTMHQRPASSKVSINDTISFPYAFPSHGTYYLWVQMRKKGKVYSQRFTLHIAAHKTSIPQLGNNSPSKAQ